MEMKTLRVAILGQGRSGRDIHGKFLREKKPDGRFEIAYVAEPMKRRRERAREEYGCAVTADYRELFSKKDIDLVVNATPSHLHPPITEEFLNHGFNVLSEKPFARTAAQVDSLIAAAEKNGTLLAVFQQSRFAPYFLKIQEILKSGVLGRIIQISIQFDGFGRRWDWQCCQEFCGGNLYNTGPHPLDQALRLLDYPEMPGVLCKMDRVNSFGDAEDYVKLILTAPDRPLIDLQISSCNAYSDFLYHIQGSTGNLKGGLTEIKWRWFKPEEAPPQKLIKTPLCGEDELPAYCSENLKWYEDVWTIEGAGTFTVAVDSLYQSLYDNLTKGTPLPVTPRQVRQQIAVIEECKRQNPLPVW
jgi:predicted dehydrogenase